VDKEDLPRQIAKVLGLMFDGTPQDDAIEAGIYLCFVSYVSENLQTSIQRLEKHDFSWMEIHSVMTDLRDRLVDKQRNDMYGTTPLLLLENLEDSVKRQRI